MENLGASFGADRLTGDAGPMQLWPPRQRGRALRQWHADLHQLRPGQRPELHPELVHLRCPGPPRRPGRLQRQWHPHLHQLRLAGTQDFAQNWFAYDAQGRLDYQDVYYDNGSRTFIQFDQDNSQGWTQAWFTYDAQGRLDTQDVINDDGSHTFYNYDQAMTETFSVVALLYNPAGTLTTQVTTWDNGTQTYTYY